MPAEMATSRRPRGRPRVVNRDPDDPWNFQSWPALVHGSCRRWGGVRAGFDRSRGRGKPHLGRGRAGDGRVLRLRAVVSWWTWRRESNGTTRGWYAALTWGAGAVFGLVLWLGIEVVQRLNDSGHRRSLATLSEALPAVALS